jgi:hypothetical protein
MKSINTGCFRRGCVALLVLLAMLGAATAQAERVARILYVGDSWTGFMWGFRSMKTALELPEYAADGLSRWIETGSSTAIMGAKAFEFLWPARQAAVEESLDKFPNVDVVLMTLGGNDFSGGFDVNIPGVGIRKNVDWYDWYMENEWDNDTVNNPNPNQSADWPEQALFNQLKSDMREILRYILARRPDIRIAIVGYDRTCRKSYQRPGLTIARQNQGLLKMEETKRDLAMEPEFYDRVEYIQSFGLIQRKYGYFTTNEWGDTGIEPYPPARALYTNDPDYIQPGVIELPSTKADGYFPWPGGDPLHQDPRLAYIDEDIHLQREGYDLSAKHALDVKIREWLNYPKVLSIISKSKLGGTETYEVTFSEAVNGVDVTDFEAFLEAKAGMKAASITSVLPSAGGVKWTVTANLGGVSGNVLLRVLDNGSIARTDNGVQLGGPGAGNGVFEYNGTYVFQDMVRPDDSDFNASLNYLDIAFEPYLSELLPSLSFRADRFDANGVLSDGGSFADPYKIPGNTLLESYEFALITHMLTHPTLDLSARGGPKAADVIAAWQNNITQMQATLGGLGSIGDVLLPGLDTLLAGYMTLGDSSSTNLAILLTTMLNQVDNFPTDVGALNPAAYTGFPTAFGADADADRDGYTNEQEFAYFLPDGAAAYAAAALDPAQTPKSGAGLYEIGNATRLPLMTRPAWDGTIRWYRNGQPLSDGANVQGSQGRCLVLDSLGEADGGNYTCVYQTATGGASNRVFTSHTYGPVIVRVGATVPVAAPLGLAMLAAAAGFGGVSALRRRRR